MKFLIDILSLFSAKLCFVVLYYFCINLIIIVTSDVLTATCFGSCRSSSGYCKCNDFFGFFVLFLLFYYPTFMLLNFVWWNSRYRFELSAGLLHLCCCMTQLGDVVWVCHYFSVLSNKTSERTFITSPQWP